MRGFPGEQEAVDQHVADGRCHATEGDSVECDKVHLWTGWHSAEAP